jgi:hypothetical protein
MIDRSCHSSLSVAPLSLTERGSVVAIPGLHERVKIRELQGIEYTPDMEIANGDKSAVV